MKRSILLVVVGLLAFLALDIGIVGKGVADEASSFHDVLETAVEQREPRLQITRVLNQLGLTLASTKGSTDLKGTGADHSVFLYHTWLTVDVVFNPKDEVVSYKMDRQGKWL